MATSGQGQAARDDKADSAGSQHATVMAHYPCPHTAISRTERRRTHSVKANRAMYDAVVVEMINWLRKQSCTVRVPVPGGKGPKTTPWQEGWAMTHGSTESRTSEQSKVARPSPPPKPPPPPPPPAPPPAPLFSESAASAWLAGRGCGNFDWSLLFRVHGRTDAQRLAQLSRIAARDKTIGCAQDVTMQSSIKEY